MSRIFFTVIPKCSKDTTFMLESWREQFIVINRQMSKLNSHFICFISNGVKPISNLKHIEFRYMNEVYLLNKYFMEIETNKIIEWDNPVRLSDVLRIVLSLENPKYIYMDTDIVFLKKNYQLFNNYFVAFCIWKDEMNALEMTNSIFYLPRKILIYMINFIKLRIVKPNKKYFYTELGPSMFHKVIFNSNEPLAMYSQNHPWNHNIDSIKKDIQKHNHTFLHLTGAIRKKHSNYCELVSKISNLNN